jgi:hypothetical protein
VTPLKLLTKPFQAFFRTEAAGGILLLACACAADLDRRRRSAWLASSA